MKRKITWVGKDWGFYIVQDFTDCVNDLKKYEGFTDEQIDEYFKVGEFTPEEVRENNGKHFLYGVDESIYQSDMCPPQLYDDKVIKYIVEEVN